jgi:hypothetical protein
MATATMTTAPAIHSVERFFCFGACASISNRSPP